jgi:CNT family concentrative nucleoside transporter
MKLVSVAGMVIFLFLCWLLSENKKRIPWKTIIVGILLQLIFALLILKTYVGRIVFDAANVVFMKIIGFSEKGAMFVFGNLVTDTSIGAIVAFKVLPIIIFVSALSGILYFLGVIQFFINLIARVMYKTMALSGAEAFSAASFIFLGIEAVTFIKDYISKMTRSELFVVMSSFMATIASSVMVTYASFGAEPGHLLAASIMSAPAAVVIAKIIVPERDVPETIGTAKIKIEVREHNIIEAAASGTSAGLKLALEVGAMLIAFISILEMINTVFILLGTTFDKVMGYVFSPFAYLMGVPFSEARLVGQLLGIKTVFNEFLAYLKMKEFIAQGLLSQRSVVISTYALCGFANFGSLGIIIAGISSLAPERRCEVASLGIKSIISGTFASFLTAIIANWLI